MNLLGPLGTDRRYDAGAVLLGTIGAVFLAGEAESSGRLTDGPLFWALVAGLVASGLLWWRRSYPVPVALAVAAISGAAEPAGIAVLVAVYTVAVLRPWTVAAATAGFAAVVVIPYTIAGPDDGLPVVAANLLGVALLAVAVATGAMIRARGELAASEQEKARRAVEEARREEERLRARERERIAREMHDVLAHRISLVSLHAGALEVRPDLTPEQVAEAAGTIRANAHQALEDLREILGVLRSDDDSAGLRPQPGTADLADLVEQSRAAGAVVEFEDRLSPAVAPTSGRTIYRVVQEALTNAAKHAPGAPVRVRVEQGPDGEVHVAMRNPLPAGPAGDSPGTPGIPGAGAGLVGLAERVRLAGGRIDSGLRRLPDGRCEFRLEVWL